MTMPPAISKLIPEPGMKNATSIRTSITGKAIVRIDLRKEKSFLVVNTTVVRPAKRPEVATAACWIAPG